MANDEDALECQPLCNELITDHETISIKVRRSDRVMEDKMEVISWKNYSKQKLIEEHNHNTF